MFESIERIFAIVRPRKLLYIAIDGVAPRAKLNEQRSRRFRAAKERAEKIAEIERVRAQILANGGQVPPYSPEFDRNCITPGTPFMFKLAESLRYFIHQKLNEDPAWKGLIVSMSDANAPGEGEHKIMNFIRRQRANPDYEPNTHHVLYGADADLIMLALATHEPNFTIMREEYRPYMPTRCDVCSQRGHETKECKGLTSEKSSEVNELSKPAPLDYFYLHISVLREYLYNELCAPDLPFKFDIERAIDDWVCMFFFVGNDFLPRLPSLDFREGAIDRLVELYKNMAKATGGYLTNAGDVYLERLQLIVAGIGQVEDKIFRDRHYKELGYLKRLKEMKIKDENKDKSTTASSTG